MPAMREFQFAIAADELIFLLGGHHAVALTAANETCEGKFVLRLGAGIPIAPKQCLHPVIFRLGDHWFMFALIPLGAPLGVFKPAIIEWLVENLVDGASGKGIASRFSFWSRAKPPFLTGNFQNLRWGMDAGQHQIPHLPDERKTLRVFDECVFTGELVCMVQVASRSDARIPAVLNLGFEAALDVFAQVIHVFLRHAKFDIHEDDVVILAGIALGRGHDFDAVLFDGPDDGTTVHRVASQTIQFPANDAGGFAPVEALHHLVENRSARFFGGF